ncbi:hypothetical protein IF1G_04892 [Cordyceps javanica]|uniref:Uncharacterized protein n=1 Tax=Cordyceps javanica TaxID=43265 RepID=A0A545V3L0_9HYPO|nr:hypothetical protein IF1G_04892 [Cordyceps javanica]
MDACRHWSLDSSIRTRADPDPDTQDAPIFFPPISPTTPARQSPSTTKHGVACMPHRHGHAWACFLHSSLQLIRCKNSPMPAGGAVVPPKGQCRRNQGWLPTTAAACGIPGGGAGNPGAGFAALTRWWAVIGWRRRLAILGRRLTLRATTTTRRARSLLRRTGQGRECFFFLEKKISLYYCCRFSFFFY